MSQASSQRSLSATTWPGDDNVLEGATDTAILQLLDGIDSPSQTLQERLNSTDNLVDNFLGHICEEISGRRILKTVCSQLISAFDDVLTKLPVENVDLSKFSVPSLLASLQDGIRIIQCIENLIARLITVISNRACDTTLANISPLPYSTIAVLTKSYGHCKNSERLYGKFFKHTSNVLGTLFQRTYTLQKSFSSALAKIKLSHGDGGSDKTRKTAAEISDGLLGICEIIAGMDDMLLATTWKLLLGFLVEFEAIRNNGISPVPYLTLLCENTRDSVSYTIQLFAESSHLLSKGDQSTKKALARSAKFSNFFLTTLSDLIKVFPDSLGRDACGTVLGFLYNLYAKLKPRMKKFKGNGQQTSDVEIKFIVEVLSQLENVTTLLVSEDSFVNFFLNTDIKSLDSCFGNLKFLLCVIKTLVKNTTAAPRWFQTSAGEQPVTHLLQIVIEEILKALQDLNTPVNEADATVSLYDAVIIHLCAFASSMPIDVFSSMEEIIFQNLFSDDPRRNILSSDLLITLCEISKPLCDHYVKVLSEMLRSVDSLFELPLNIRIIARVLKRISCGILLDKDEPSRDGWPRTILCAPSDVSQSTYSKEFLVIGDQLESELSAAAKTDVTIERLKNLTKLCEKFLKYAEVSQNCHELPLKTLFKSVLDFWSKIHEDFAESAITSNFLIAFIDVNKFCVTTAPNISISLSSLFKFVSSNAATASIKLKIIQFLPEMVASGNRWLFEDPLPKLFSTLTMDSNWRIQHETLNSFEIVTRSKNGSDLLTNSAIISNISSKIENHFSFECPDPTSHSELFVKYHQKFESTSVRQLYEDWRSYQLELLQNLSKLDKMETKDNEAIDLMIKAGSQMRTSISQLNELCAKQDFAKVSIPTPVMDDLKTSRTMLESIAKRLGI